MSGRERLKTMHLFARLCGCCWAGFLTSHICVHVGGRWNKHIRGGNIYTDAHHNNNNNTSKTPPSHIPDIPHIPSGIKTGVVALFSLYYGGSVGQISSRLAKWQNKNAENFWLNEIVKKVINDTLIKTIRIYCTNIPFPSPAVRALRLRSKSMQGSGSTVRTYF